MKMTIGSFECLIFVFTIAVARAVTIARDSLGTISVNVEPSVIRSGSWVNVSYDGVPDFELNRNVSEYICQPGYPYCKDVIDLSLWIGSFPIGSNLSNIGPQEWQTGTPPWLATSPIQWKPLSNTSGTVDFYIESTRQSIQFSLFSNGTTYPIHLGTSNTLQFSNLHAPQHVRIAHASALDRSTMRVSWSALDLDGEAEIRYGTESGNYTGSISAKPKTYDREDLCGPPATAHGYLKAPWFYSGIVTGLRPDRKYYYIVGSNNAMGYSREFYFFGPKPPSADSHLRITAFADMGEKYIDDSEYHWIEPFSINTTSRTVHPWNTEGMTPLTLNPMILRKTKDGKQSRLAAGSGKVGKPSGKVLSAIRKHHISYQVEHHSDVVVHVGDISYATGYESEWDRFMTQIEPLSAHTPYMIAEGNHERDYSGSGNDIGYDDSGGECGIPTQARFPMPTPSHTQSDIWFSWEQGPVHFVMMNTEKSLYENSSQYNFVKQDLLKIDRSITPFVIVMGHRPFYSSSSGATASHGWWPGLEKLLFENEVDLCLAGHVHNTERTCPIYNQTCIIPETSDTGKYVAPIHAVIGNAGQSIAPFQRYIPPWSLFRYKGYGYSTIEVDGPGRLLTMKFWSDEEGKLLHTFTIQKKKRTEIFAFDE